MIGRAIRTFREKLDEVKAEQKGEARSHARLVKQAQAIPELCDTQEITVEGKTFSVQHLKKRAPGAAQPTKVGVRMLDGKPMVFFNDGSIRHAMGVKPGKAARKAMKRFRRQQNVNKVQVVK